MHNSAEGANATDDAVTCCILEAICTGDLATLKTNLKVPAHRSLRSPEGKTLLHVAAGYGHPEVVTYLLESGWQVYARTSSEDTPLHCAARAYIRPEAGEVLFGSGTVWDPTLPKCSEETERGIIQLLRIRGLDAPESIGAIDDLPQEERWPLYEAVLQWMWDRVRLRRELIATGIPFDANDPTFKFIRHGDSDYLKVANLLIEAGAEVDAMNERGHSPLAGAVESNSLPIVELLLQNKADPNLKHRGNDRWYSSPMEDALEGNAEAAALLYRFGGRVNFIESRPLHRAAGNGRLKTLLWLLDIGGDINQRDGDGDTPLLSAAGGHEEIVAALRERGADLRVVNNNGQGVLHLAGGWAQVLKLFLGYGLDANARDQTGLAPLHYAARGLSDDSIPLLLSAGARVNAQDDDGNTPLHIIFFSEEFRPDIEFPSFKALVDGGADKTIANKAGETAFDLARKYRYPAEYLELLTPSLRTSD